MSMAHGHYFATGRPAAVILHTNVGLANGAIGAINAATDHVPMIVMSGRTPTTESGRFGARTVPIGWGQEMRDQAALVREACKWEYEVRFPEQVPELLDRALRDRHQHPARARCTSACPARCCASRVPPRRSPRPRHAAGRRRRRPATISPAPPRCSRRRATRDHRPARRRHAGRLRRARRARRPVVDPGLPVVGGRHRDRRRSTRWTSAPTRHRGSPTPTSCW